MLCHGPALMYEAGRAGGKMEKKGKKVRIPDRLHYWLMVLPAVVLVFLFNTRTWPGILAAFQDFIPIKGWFGSKWIGLRNFRIFFMQPNSWFSSPSVPRICLRMVANMTQDMKCGR